MPKANVKEIQVALDQAFGEEEIELCLGGEAIGTKDRWISGTPVLQGETTNAKMLDMLQRLKVGNVVAFAAGDEMVASVLESPETWKFSSEEEKEKTKAIMFFFANAPSWIKQLIAENKDLRDQRDFLMLDTRTQGISH